MSEQGCVFCVADDPQVFHEGRLVRGRWDDFPDMAGHALGHALLIPRRHVTSWFEATPEERAELAEATLIARESILARYSADGFNLLVNAGFGAGQSVPHLHLHVLPQYGPRERKRPPSGEAAHQRVIQGLRDEVLRLRAELARVQAPPAAEGAGSF